uniref:Uncharacterized protein n=1 Tax=Fagus sylvatica TaxID=28930 RepID=A0A2N9HZR2_FAGSY
MYPGLHFKGFWARWVLVGLETARSNLGQTLVNTSQTWSTLVKLGQLGQTLGNVSRTFFLGVFDVESPRCRIMLARFRAVPFCVPTPEKIPWKDFSERAKIESFILCPTSLVPRSAKQRRGNCHNPIFTHGIFSGVGTQNGTALDRASMIRRSLAMSNTPKKKVRDTFPKPIWEATFAQKILSDPLQLGPRAKTLRQEVHFSYHTQLSDRQELLRSSRNLSQKMTPWHKEHSDGLRSQDHILRTQARLCARPVPLENR